MTRNVDPETRLANSGRRRRRRLTASESIPPSIRVSPPVTAGARAGATAARRRCRSCLRQSIGDRHARPTVTRKGLRPARWPGPDRRAGFQPAPRLLHHAALGAAGLVTAARAGRPHGLWATKNRHDAARSGPAGAGWRCVPVSPIRVSDRLALCSRSPVRVSDPPVRVSDSDGSNASSPGCRAPGPSRSSRPRPS